MMLASELVSGAGVSVNIRGVADVHMATFAILNVRCRLPFLLQAHDTIEEVQTITIIWEHVTSIIGKRQYVG